MVGSVAVVGAGLGGAMMATYLGRRGLRVDVFERREDPRRHDAAYASMNLGLSRRGLDALERLGLAEQALEESIPMTGRIVHDLRGGLAHQPYGKDRRQVIHAIGRRDINALLLDAAEACGEVRLRFSTRCVDLDAATGALTLRDERAGAVSEETFDFVVGADGVSSAVRKLMHQGIRSTFEQEALPWGWKEIRIPPSHDGTHQMEKNAFHLWPRGGSMLFAHPNLDGSFTCSLVLPYEGELSFASLSMEEAIVRYFERELPDLLEQSPDAAEQFLNNPIIQLHTIRTEPWHRGGRVVLLGDSAHGVVPFMAQGMNAAFEDCCALDACIARHPDDLAAAFHEYERDRRPHTDALAEMSIDNFLELRDRVRSPGVKLKKRIDGALHEALGERWMPLHARVTHTTTPYATAVALTRRQDRLLAAALAVLLALLLAGAALALGLI